jgi:predicted RNA binding protein with dsRBD fold (UPF0201 family)
MTVNRKEQARRLAASIQQSTAPEAQQVKQMIGLLLEDARHNLVTSEGDSLLRLQGEARLLQRLHDQLTNKRVQLAGREQ